MKLESEVVSEIFHDCLFKDEEDKTNFVPAEGITTSVGFHPGRLEEHRSEIQFLLKELPDVFHEKTGGGMSFLQACMDKDGHQWTGLHSVMQELFLLGIGIGKVQCLLPREVWPALPGGVPYYVVKD